MSDEHDNWMRGMGIDIDKLVTAAKDTEAAIKGGEASVTRSLQSAQSEGLTALGASPETIRGVQGAEQAVVDFNRGRQQGQNEGTADLLNMAAPVQFVKAGARLAEADDTDAEAKKIAGEKLDAMAGIAGFVVNPAGGGRAIGESLGKKTLQAQKEERLAEFSGNLVGHGDVIAATVAAGGGVAGLAEGGAVVAAEGGAAVVAEGGAAVVAEGGGAVVAEGGAAVVAEGGAAVVGEGGAAVVGEGGAAVVSEGGAAVTGEGGAAVAGEGGTVATGEGGAAASAEPIPSTEFPATEPAGDAVPRTLRSSPGGNPISPAAESVRGSQVGRPPPSEIPPTELPEPGEPAPPTKPSQGLVSPEAQSVPAPEVGEAVPDTDPTPSEPFLQSKSFNPPNTEVDPSIAPKEPFPPSSSFNPPNTEVTPSNPSGEPFPPSPSFNPPNTEVNPPPEN